MTTEEFDFIKVLAAMDRPPAPPEVGEAYESMIASLRDFLDALVGARIDQAEIAELTGLLQRWTPVLREREVREIERLWGHWGRTPGRGQALAPAIRDEVVVREEPFTVSATVTFGRFFVGENWAVHGGAVSLMFDDMLGRLSHTAGLPPSRTAYLKTDFRSITQVGHELRVEGRLDRVEGRKRFLYGALYDGERLCAEAEGLWVELKPGQQ